MIPMKKYEKKTKSEKQSTLKRNFLKTPELAIDFDRDLRSPTESPRDDKKGKGREKKKEKPKNLHLQILDSDRHVTPVLKKLFLKKETTHRMQLRGEIFQRK